MLALLLLLLAVPVAAQLQCPFFTDLALSEQPIVPGRDCSDNNPVPGTCVAVEDTEALACLTAPVFVLGPSTNGSSVFACNSFECIQTGTPCGCQQTTVCERTVNDAPKRFLCIDASFFNTTTTTTTTAPTATAPNYCDDDDDLSVDCSKPRDNTATLLVVLFGALITLILGAACFCSPRTRERRFAE